MKNVKLVPVEVRVNDKTLFTGLGYPRAEKFVRRQFKCEVVTASVLYNLKMITSDGRDLTPRVNFDLKPESKGILRQVLRGGRS